MAMGIMGEIIKPEAGERSPSRRTRCGVAEAHDDELEPGSYEIFVARKNG
jgi:hypothetical protein